MNILVVAIGSYGDVLPLIGLARQLYQRGHTVTFFSNGHFADLVRQAGLEFIPMGTATDYDAMADHPDLWHPHKGWRLIMTRLVSEGLQEAYHLLRSHLTPPNTIMISSTLGFVARLLQETHHVPHATVHFSPGVFHSAYHAPKMPDLPLPDWLPVPFKRGVWTLLDHTLIDPVMKTNLNRFRGKLGLPPVSRIFHNWLHSPHLVLGLFPEWFAPSQPDWPPQTQATGFPLFDDPYDAALLPAVQEFLAQGSAPLVFTPGSAMKHGRRFFLESAEACQVLERRGIFLTQYSEQLPRPLPKEVQHFSYIPLSQLLPHSAALIHHGGIGTCSQALRAGIPQLIQPMAFDQFDNAARVKKLGVGAMISKRSFRAPKIAQRLQHLLGSAVVETQCRRITKNFVNEDAILKSCERIEATLIPL